VCRHVCEVEHDRRPELHVGLQHPVGPPLAKLGECCLLECFGDLEARRGQLARRASEHTCTGVLGTVDAVSEAHQPLAVVEQLLDVGGGVVAALDLLDHAEYAGGSAAVQRPGHRADRG